MDAFPGLQNDKGRARRHKVKRDTDRSINHVDDTGGKDARGGSEGEGDGGGAPSGAV